MTSLTGIFHWLCLLFRNAYFKNISERLLLLSELNKYWEKSIEIMNNYWRFKVYNITLSWNFFWFEKKSVILVILAIRIKKNFFPYLSRNFFCFFCLININSLSMNEIINKINDTNEINLDQRNQWYKRNQSRTTKSMIQTKSISNNENE